MKTVFDGTDVVTMFVAQSQEHGRTANSRFTRTPAFYFHDNIAYSYGSHYPLARFYNGVVHIAVRDSSATTDKFNSRLRVELTRQGIEYVEVVNVLGDDKTALEANTAHLTECIAESNGKAKRSRKYKDMHIDDAAKYRRMLHLLIHCAVAA